MQFIHRNKTLVIAPDATMYMSVVLGQARGDGALEGYLCFETARSRPPFRSFLTGRETTQPSRSALEYWATGLEPVYLEGALGRALESLVPGCRPAVRAVVKHRARTAPNRSPRRRDRVRLGGSWRGMEAAPI
jgi:hypothetical protein